jgi:hypothetical protein
MSLPVRHGFEPGPYALAIGGGALTQAVLWMYLAHMRFLDPRLPPRYVAYRLATYLRIPIVFLASVPIAILVSPFLAEYSWGLVLLIGVILRRYRDVANLRPGARRTARGLIVRPLQGGLTAVAPLA